MKKNNKNFDYFDYFAECAKEISTAAVYLHEYAQSYDATKINEHVEEMHRMEHKVDSMKHEMHTVLAHEFITPIEREDIITFSQELDDVMDAIDDVMQKFYMFNVTEMRKEAIVFTDLIVKCCSSLETAVKEFKNFKKSKTITDCIIDINTIESEGDKYYNEFTHNLYTSTDDVKTLLVWRNILESLENCLDECEDAADVIVSVVMKNT